MADLRRTRPTTMTRTEPGKGGAGQVRRRWEGGGEGRGWVGEMEVLVKARAARPQRLRVTYRDESAACLTDAGNKSDAD